ncbi:TonB C-terminal domain-containing protein [Acinetobacter sp. MB5]|uniref:TonB C-terminal domain-containing protein n=1 Tax=Acinetobacter sp. MB5 TaxID=2069438 RepID=UPI000DD0DF1D|nr:TonB C-terminal domain-containing protein [Acinetobacter sp. MB5]
MLNLKSTFRYFSIALITCINLGSSYSVSAQQTASIPNQLKPTKMRATPETKKQANIDAACRHTLNLKNTLETDEELSPPQLAQLYKCKIRAAWDVPDNTAEQTAKVKIQLDSSGNVLSTEIQSNSKEMQDGIRQAILQSAPYPYSKSNKYPNIIYITFTAK